MEHQWIVNCHVHVHLQVVAGYQCPERTTTLAILTFRKDFEIFISGRLGKKEVEERQSANWRESAGGKGSSDEAKKYLAGGTFATTTTTTTATSTSYNLHHALSILLLFDPI
jgi:hypothetical protein